MDLKVYQQTKAQARIQTKIYPSAEKQQQKVGSHVNKMFLRFLVGDESIDKKSISIITIYYKM